MNHENRQADHGLPPNPAGQEFTLVSDSDGTIGPTELSRLIERKTGSKGPTTETIRTHAKKGTITGTKDPDRGWRFASSAADEWINNHPTPRRGGRRAGAGKKKHGQSGTLPSETLTGPVADAHAARDAVGGRMKPDDDGNRGPPPPNAMLISDVLSCTRDELKALVYFNGHDGLMPSAAIDRLKELQSLQLADLKLAEKRGELVEASKIALAWATEQQRIAGLVIDIAKQVAPRIANACWVSDEHCGRICSMLKHEGVGGDIISVVSHELSKPPELAGRVREMIDDAVRRVMAEVAKPAKDD